MFYHSHDKKLSKTIWMNNSQNKDESTPKGNHLPKIKRRES